VGEREEGGEMGEERGVPLCGKGKEGRRGKRLFMLPQLQTTSHASGVLLLVASADPEVVASLFIYLFAQSVIIQLE